MSHESPERTPSQTRATAVIVRDTDAMRTEHPADVQQVTVDRLRLVSATRFAAREELKLRLRNEIQRFECELRGIVHAVSADSDAAWHIVVALHTRLTPYQLSLLRTPVPVEDGPVWI